MRPVPLVLIPALLTVACSGGGPAGEAAPATPAPGEGPALLAVTPAEGQPQGGTRVRLEGAGLFDELPIWVRFGDRIVEALAWDDGVLEVSTPPADAAGSVDVAVVTTRGRAVLPQAFRYWEPSPFVSLTPAVGFHDDTNGGTPITVVVFNRPPLDAPRVSFGGVEATSVHIWDGNTLVARVPPGLPGGGLVDVRIEDGWVIAAGGFRVQGVLEPGALIVNEWMAHGGIVDANADGTASAGGDEFVEIVNRLGVDVDLSGSSLHDASALRHRFPNPTTVPAGGAIVVFGFGNPRGFADLHASGQAQVASTGNLGLNNGGDRIALLDASGALLFEVVYGGTDVEPGVSRQNPVDGGALPSDARGSDYVRHDELSASPSSPGLRLDDTPFE